MRITLKITTVSGENFKSACKAAEITMAKQIMTDTEPYVPALTGVFSNRTWTDGNEIVYTADQVRYLWYGKVMVNRDTGKGPMNIPGVGLRYKEGTKLKPTDRDLVFTTNMHPKAQSHWMEASYKKNGDQWVRDAEKAVKHFLG